MSVADFDAVTAILVVPVASAVVLVLIANYRVSAVVNVLSSLTTLLAAATMFVFKPATGLYFLVDDLNIVFIVLNTFVAFTTSLAFSPTDTIPLTRRAKMLMLLQAIISLVTLTGIAGSAINILGGGK